MIWRAIPVELNAAGAAARARRRSLEFSVWPRPPACGKTASRGRRVGARGTAAAVVATRGFARGCEAGTEEADEGGAAGGGGATTRGGGGGTVFLNGGPGEEIRRWGWPPEAGTDDTPARL